MNLVSFHKGPYFHAPCQRDRFPSVVDELGEDGDKLVAHLGISNMSDMGARLKRGRTNSKIAEQRAADYVKDACVPLQDMFRCEWSEMRRGVDKYAQTPKFDPYLEENQQLCMGQRQHMHDMRHVPSRMRQAGEPPYIGNCQHCRRRGSSNEANDFQGRMCLQQAYMQINLWVLGEENEAPPVADRNNNNG